MGYAELQVTSNFSFLRGASHPEELVLQAHALGLDAIAITDRNTLAGVVRAHCAAREVGIRLVVGARLDLLPDDALPPRKDRLISGPFDRPDEATTAIIPSGSKSSRAGAPPAARPLDHAADAATPTTPVPIGTTSARPDASPMAESPAAALSFSTREAEGPPSPAPPDAGSMAQSSHCGPANRQPARGFLGSHGPHASSQQKVNRPFIQDADDERGHAILHFEDRLRHGRDGNGCSTAGGSRHDEGDTVAEGPSRTAGDTANPAVSLLCLPTDRAAYGRLARLISKGQRRVEKGLAALWLGDVIEHAEGQILVVLPPPVPDASFGHVLDRLRATAPACVYLAAQFLYRGDDRARIERLAQLADRHQTPLVATGDVLYHTPARRPLQDVLSCIREKCTIDEAGLRLQANAERHLKPANEMERLFGRWPEAVGRTAEIVRACRFSLSELAYDYPIDPPPDGLTEQAWLERLTWEGAAERYPDGVPDHVRDLLEHEFRLIEELGYAPYFLTVCDIVRYARSRGILCQGRGSAANSAVCYCLGVTAVDPSRFDLLFERFVSAERNEPPDIDVDFEHERREEVIQYIYRKYGREHAGIAATVIHYRTRSAIREVGKALGLSADVVGGLAGSIWGWSNEGVATRDLKERGMDPAEPRIATAVRLSRELIGFPRHLSQHVGGFVLTRSRLDTVVPVVNGAMPERTFVEWDKDDLDALGILKIDVLGLGMLTCIRKAFELLDRHHGKKLGLATVPAEDPAVYEMLSRGDSLGVFQVESRAQMTMLPRLRPACFYDLIVEVAIVRPGPIQGDMVHPYLRRRAGLEPVVYPSGDLKQVLEKTLGVPLFQEQAMKIAIIGAGFTPTESDRLRRAMATFKQVGTIDRLGKRFIEGMVANGYEREFAEKCFKQIEGFGTYGFPESHAASFALLVYVSSWIKCHHPEVFAAALLNSQPMGFYAPAQIVRDARDHGVAVLPVDVNASHCDATLEAAAPEPSAPMPSAASAASDAEPDGLEVGEMGYAPGPTDEDLVEVSAAAHPHPRPGSSAGSASTTNVPSFDVAAGAVSGPRDQELADDYAAPGRDPRYGPADPASPHAGPIPVSDASSSLDQHKKEPGWRGPDGADSQAGPEIDLCAGFDDAAVRAQSEPGDAETPALEDDGSVTAAHKPPSMPSGSGAADGLPGSHGPRAHSQFKVEQTLNGHQFEFAGGDSDFQTLEPGVIRVAMTEFEGPEAPASGQADWLYPAAVSGPGPAPEHASGPVHDLLTVARHPESGPCDPGSPCAGLRSRTALVAGRKARDAGSRPDVAGDLEHGQPVGREVGPTSVTMSRRDQLLGTDLARGRRSSRTPAGVPSEPHASSGRDLRSARARQPSDEAEDAPATQTGEERYGMGRLDAPTGRLALRLGFRQVKGLKEDEMRRLVAARGRGYADLAELRERARVGQGALDRLARADAFGSMALDRRAAIWTAIGLDRTGHELDPPPLFAWAERRATGPEPAVALPAMSTGQHVAEDYRTLRLTLRSHPLALLRPRLPVRTIRAADLAGIDNGRRVEAAGLVLVRQRPGTASGVIFITLEDETGVINLVVWPKVFERFRRVVLGAQMIAVKGEVQKDGLVIHVIAGHLADRTDLLRDLSNAEIEAPVARADRFKRPNDRRSSRAADSFESPLAHADHAKSSGGPDSRDPLWRPRDIDHHRSHPHLFPAPLARADEVKRNVRNTQPSPDERRQRHPHEKAKLEGFKSRDFH